MRPFKNGPVKDTRFIVYDLEAKTSFQPDPTIMKFSHEVRYFYWKIFIFKVNFAYAWVFCSRCVEKNIWDKPLEEACAICGENRSFAFAPFDFEGTDVDVFVKTENVLADLAHWIIHFEQDELGFGEVRNDLGIGLSRNGPQYSDESENEEEEEDETESNQNDFIEIEAEEEENYENLNAIAPLRNSRNTAIKRRGESPENVVPKRRKVKPKKQQSFKTICYAHAGKNIFKNFKSISIHSRLPL